MDYLRDNNGVFYASYSGDVSVPEGHSTITILEPEQVTFIDKNLGNCKFSDEGVLVLVVTPPSKTPVELFQPSLAIAREAQVFNEEEMDRFSAVSYMVNELIRYKNFWGGTLPGDITYVGLKQMATKFIATGKITQSDYVKLNSILKEQNIDLDVPQ